MKLTPTVEKKKKIKEVGKMKRKVEEKRNRKALTAWK